MKKPKPKIKEIDLQKQIVEYLNLQGHFVWRNNSGLFFVKGKSGKTRAIRAGLKGSSDILGVLNGGTIIAIECKIAYNRPTIEQLDFLNRITSLGGVAFIAYSLEDVINNLKNYI